MNYCRHSAGVTCVIQVEGLPSTFITQFYFARHSPCRDVACHVFSTMFCGDVACHVSTGRCNVRRFIALRGLFSCNGLPSALITRFERVGYRHCWGAARSNQMINSILNCFASLAMTKWRRDASRLYTGQQTVHPAFVILYLRPLFSK
jgi:hypothetical protein